SPRSRRALAHRALSLNPSPYPRKGGSDAVRVRLPPPCLGGGLRRGSSEEAREDCLLRFLVLTPRMIGHERSEETSHVRYAGRLSQPLFVQGEVAASFVSGGRGQTACTGDEAKKSPSPELRRLRIAPSDGRCAPGVDPRRLQRPRAARRRAHRRRSPGARRALARRRRLHAFLKLRA